jgi:hypothetical protein
VSIFGVSDSALCRSVWDMSPNTINPTGMSVLFWQDLSLAGSNASPVCTSPYLLLAGWLSTLPVSTLYSHAKFFSFITLWSDNKLIIMCLVSKTGTVPNELLCNLTVPLIGQSALEFSVFCVEVRSDLLLLSLANLSKSGEKMYCWNIWQISSYWSKLVLCFMKRSFNKIWDFVTAIIQIWHQRNEVLSSMSSFNSSSLLTQLSESKVEARKSSICSISSYSSLYYWFKSDYWNTFVSNLGVKLDRRGLAAELPMSLNISSQLVLLQCLMWCLNDFCVVNQHLQSGHCLFDWVVIVWISYTLLDQLLIHWIIMKLSWWGKLIVTNKQWLFPFTRFHIQNNWWIHMTRILENMGKKYLTRN